MNFGKSFKDLVLGQVGTLDALAFPTIEESGKVNYYRARHRSRALRSPS